MKVVSLSLLVKYYSIDKTKKLKKRGGKNHSSSQLLCLGSIDTKSESGGVTPNSGNGGDKGWAYTIKFRMDSAEHGGDEQNGKIITIYSDFMMRIAKFDELVSTGSRFLVSFHQALGFLQRDPINRASKLVERIMKAHESRRVASYFEAGCGNSHDSVQNVSKSKVVVEELECLLGMAASSVQTSKEKDGDASCDLDSCIASSVLTEKEKEKEEDSSCDLDSRSISTDNISRTKCTHLQERPNAADYGSMMAIVYSMVKQDYTMQVRIVSSLNHKSSQGELETYCQMWNLRPFVDDEIMQKAWNLVPGR